MKISIEIFKISKSNYVIISLDFGRIRLNPLSDEIINILLRRTSSIHPLNSSSLSLGFHNIMIGINTAVSFITNQYSL